MIDGGIGALRRHGTVHVTPDAIWFLPSTLLQTGPPDPPWKVERSELGPLRAIAWPTGGHVQSWNATYRHWDNVYSGWSAPTVARDLEAQGWPVERMLGFQWRKRRRRPG